MPNRFRETSDNIYSFSEYILVKCPKCSLRAVVFASDRDRQDLFAPHRFVCAACGATKDWTGAQVNRNWDCEPVDYYFQYPLWLQTPCCGHTLWAYNFRHLDLIEAFVSAKLRERRPDENYGWSNQSLYSRLPKWIKSGKNRSSILKAIERMRLLV
ncbi:hypothetical protein [Chamaesiphon polymorphus]|uniref:Uncharacterized protein n=1 Tax=Chamaesiphon polymorphus CCALA 037 TaxID=2107692 RepID=A0A2T1GKY9_9CYAN|nr:hypothetical protein [Chamaesiphon polymorphus]PSB58517.1 hypothetical protein C7B77_04400 [Chamaesiphon polymorphus CCALA 037]